MTKIDLIDSRAECVHSLGVSRADQEVVCVSTTGKNGYDWISSRYLIFLISNKNEIRLAATHDSYNQELGCNVAFEYAGECDQISIFIGLASGKDDICLVCFDKLTGEVQEVHQLRGSHQEKNPYKLIWMSNLGHQGLDTIGDGVFYYTGVDAKLMKIELVKQVL